MFYLKTTVRKTKKKNIGSFLAVLFCTLVIVSSIGTSFGIRNSFAQAQQQQIQQAPTVAYNSPWSNNLRIRSASSNSQPLCAAGICGQSADPPSTTTQPQSSTSSSSTSTSSGDPTTVTLTKSFTNSKPLSLRHSFVSNKVVGPDRFRYIGYYWTTPNTPRGVDVGTSSGVGIGFGGGTAQPPNVKQEVDTNEGQKTLAIQLQYQGVVNLAGVTGALKLPTGFKATNPLIDDPNRWDIALSEYKGVIQTGQGIVLYFYVNILPTAKVGLPVLGPVALHFLRPNSRTINDQMEAIPENILQRAFSNVTNVGNPLSACTSVGTAGNCTTTSLAPFTHNLDFKRDYLGQFSRQIPFDFINQEIPVIFKVSGQETLDVVTLPYGAPVSLDTISTHILKIPNDDTSRVRLAVTNNGDAGVWDMTVNVFPGLQSSLGVNGLTPSAISSPNIP
ncbi:MAG: hypothetical protein WAK17_06430, partial [Candidatus Nitrosopolaris sp.]